MRNLLKVVIDTNMFVSMLLGSKNACHVFDAFLNGRFDLIMSEKLFDEFVDVVARPKFSEIISQRECENLLKLLKTDAEWISHKEKIRVCRDPKDNIVLECAVAGKADVIITGDKDLLTLHPFKCISIFPPSRFLKYLIK